MKKMRTRKTAQERRTPEMRREGRLPTDAEQRLLLVLYAKGPLSMVQLGNLLAMSPGQHVTRHAQSLAEKGLMTDFALDRGQPLRLTQAGRDLVEVCVRHDLIPNPDAIPIRKSNQWMDASVVSIQREPPRAHTTPEEPYLPWRVHEEARGPGVPATVSAPAAPQPPLNTPPSHAAATKPEKIQEPPEKTIPKTDTQRVIAPKKPVGPIKRPTLPFNPALLGKRK